MDTDDKLKKAKRQYVVMFAAAAVALTAAIGFLIFCAAEYMFNAVPKANAHVDHVQLMEKEYGDNLQMERYLERGDIGYKENQGGFFLTSGLLNKQIRVDATGPEIVEDYLFELYRDDIYSYFIGEFEAYFPDAECEVEIMEWDWLHKTEYMEFDDYMKDMEGRHVYITMVYEEGGVPDPETFEAAMRRIQPDVNYDISISAKEPYSYCFEGHINSGEEDIDFTVRDYYTQHYG